MGVYIRGMETPKSCGECKAFVCYRQWAGDVGDCFCGITKNDAKAKGKNADCPLVPVPKHGRLIDADALITEFCEWGTRLERGRKLVITMSEAKQAIVDIIEDAPTIIPADVPENNVGNIPAEEGE